MLQVFKKVFDALQLLNDDWRGYGWSAEQGGAAAAAAAAAPAAAFAAVAAQR